MRIAMLELVAIHAPIRQSQPVNASLDRGWFAQREWSVPRARGTSLQEHFSVRQ